MKNGEPPTYVAPLHLGVYGLKEESVEFPLRPFLGTTSFSQPSAPALGDASSVSTQQDAKDNKSIMLEGTGDKRARPQIDENFTLRGAKKTRAFARSDNLPRGYVQGYYPDFQLNPEPGSRYEREIANAPLPVPAGPLKDVAPSEVDYRRNYLPTPVLRVPGTNVYYEDLGNGRTREIPPASDPKGTTTGSSSSASSSSSAGLDPATAAGGGNQSQHSPDAPGGSEQAGGSSSSTSSPDPVDSDAAADDEKQWVETDENGDPLIK